MKILPFIIALVVVIAFGLISRRRQNKLYKIKERRKDIDKLKNHRRTNLRRVK